MMHYSLSPVIEREEGRRKEEKEGEEIQESLPGFEEYGRRIETVKVGRKEEEIVEREGRSGMGEMRMEEIVGYEGV